MRLTAYDVLEYLSVYAGKSAASNVRYTASWALQNALREFAASHPWAYLRKHHRLQINAVYETGTVTYDQTGGSSERLVTLSGGTWPSWAASGSIWFDDDNNVVSRVATRINDTTLTLDSTLNPGADVAAGTGYKIFQEHYDLPADFHSVYEVEPEITFGGLRRAEPEFLLGLQRLYLDASEPEYWTVVRSPDTAERLALWVFPYATSAQTYDFIYRAKATGIDVIGESAGKITVTASSATATGDSGIFVDGMAGASLRVSKDKSKLPTGVEGENVAAEEYVISSVTDSNTLVLESTATTTRSVTSYVISDIIDFEQSAMTPAFLACCRLKYAEFGRMDHGMISNARKTYEDALRAAKVGDDRYAGRRRIGGWPTLHGSGRYASRHNKVNTEIE